MFAELLSPPVLITAAGLVQMASFLLINQTLLRLAMLVSTSLYISYYFTVGSTPLWDAIMLSSLTIATILIGMASLYARNAKWAIPKEHADIYPIFAPLQPGDFRALVNRAARYTVQSDTVVTVEGEKPPKVYFIINGTFDVNKSGAEFSVYGPTFVGEVAYLMDTPSAATTTLPAGIEVLEWSLSDLVTRSKRQPRFKLALDSVISRDLARKVSLAVSPAVRSRA